ncbi:hypothetical protein HV257_22840 [Citrobacter freundii]|uniref:hypothetical protein n=1 Tax=Citrobacter freundii TaxID=546 RepID=UPI0015EA50ED|nr:hypothetical protein [Citrobacter freundii]QLV75566.1 hypothetical protein HV257_22840 [Citrobacter freundii]HCR2155657.1 hypothetical protein [Enterobacter asburiae]
MEKIITIIAAIAGIAFWIGLINPKWVLMPNRKKSSLVYFAICIIVSAIGASLAPKQATAPQAVSTPATPPQKKEFEYATKTLNDWRLSSQKDRHNIIETYAKINEFPQSSINGFYGCVSEYSYTKSKDLQLGMVLDWCQGDYKNDPASLDNRVTFDTFEDQFNHWSGAYKPLEAAIKKSMNDDNSYEHVETTYRVMMKGTPHAIVSTTFKGTNSYGAVVKQTVAADVDIKTGQIIKILEQ